MVSPPEIYTDLHMLISNSLSRWMPYMHHSKLLHCFEFQLNYLSIMPGRIPARSWQMCEDVLARLLLPANIKQHQWDMSRYAFGSFEGNRC